MPGEVTFDVDAWLKLPGGDKLDAMLALVGLSRGDVFEHHLVLRSEAPLRRVGGVDSFDRAAESCLQDLRERLTVAANIVTGRVPRYGVDLPHPSGLRSQGYYGGVGSHPEIHKYYQPQRAWAGFVVHSGALDFGWHWNGCFRRYKLLPREIRKSARAALQVVADVCIQGRAQKTWGLVMGPRWRAPRLDILDELDLLSRAAAGLDLLSSRPETAGAGPATPSPETAGGAELGLAPPANSIPSAPPCEVPDAGGVAPGAAPPAIDVSHDKSLDRSGGAV